MQLQQFTLKQHFVLYGIRILPFLYLQLVGNFLQSTVPHQYVQMPAKFYSLLTFAI